MRTHKMKLNKEPFEKIASGKKTIEIRLNDEKRTRLRPGDQIIFSKLPDRQETVSVLVEQLYPYASFAELMEHHSMEEFGYLKETDKQRFLESIYTIYTREQEQQFGVLGIKVKLL